MKEIKKIALVGTHGTGKSTICKKIHKACYIDYSIDIMSIPEQFREIVKDIDSSQDDINNSENITFATYAKQSYLENLYTAQGKNILCDRSVLDTFVYYDYFSDYVHNHNKTQYDDANNIFDCIGRIFCTNDICTAEDVINRSIGFFESCVLAACENVKNYSKIYLIEPSNREIENDGFRMIDKKEQLKVHELFLEYFRNFDNVEIINQEDAHKEEFINKVVNEFVLCL